MSYRIIPSQEGTCRIESTDRRLDPRHVLNESYELERQRRFDEACSLRFKVSQPLSEALLGEEDMEFDFSDPTTYAAAEILYDSAIDFLVAGEYEISAAILELMLDYDSEDRFGCTSSAALCYIALGDEACFEEAIADIDIKSADYPLLRIIDNFRISRTVTHDDVEKLIHHHELVAEFLMDDHPTDDGYIADINSRHPSRRAEARAVYLKYEPIISMFDGLGEQLRSGLIELINRKTN